MNNNMTKAKAQKIIDAKALLTTGISAKETSTTTGLSLAKIYQLKKKLSTPETKETTTSETKTETKQTPTKKISEKKTKTPKQKWKGEYIPRNIAGQKTDWDIAIGCHADKTPLLLIGEAGCGKSYLPRKIAEEKNQSYVSVNCNRAITPKQLLGQHVPVKNLNETQIDYPLLNTDSNHRDYLEAPTREAIRIIKENPSIKNYLVITLTDGLMSDEKQAKKAIKELNKISHTALINISGLSSKYDFGHHEEHILKNEKDIIMSFSKIVANYKKKTIKK